MTPDARGKRVLLIAGGGTLGHYTALSLLKSGAAVTVIALEERRVSLQNLAWIRARVTDELLEELFKTERFDAVVDFLHYPDPAAYAPRMRLLASHTAHYLFLSSYRVYADASPDCLREDSPQLLDVFGETGLLRQDAYGISKSHCERLLRASPFGNWTILRPLISFSHFRFDLVTLGATQIFPRAAAGRPILLPAEARDKTAGLGWAGNAGALIARLALNPAACGEDYLIGNDENLTWGQVAELYRELLGLEAVWIDTEDYLRVCTGNAPSDRIILHYDRLFDRRVDNAKVRAATGFARDRFVGLRAALLYELSYLNDCPALLERFTASPQAIETGRRMDEYLASHPQKG